MSKWYKTQEVVPEMTRKQAVSEAIRILEENEADTGIIGKLKEIRDELPMARWTHESILDATEQYILDNGRFPPKREFTGRLPGQNTIKHFFNVTSLGEYRSKYFANALYSVRKIGYEDKDYMQDVFRRNYDRIGGGYSVSFRDYDAGRDKGSPNIHTLMRNLSCPTYNRLREMCGVDGRPSKQAYNKHVMKTEFNLQSGSTISDESMSVIRHMTDKYAAI